MRLTDKLVGFNEIITILSIQRDNRLLDNDWPGFRMIEKRKPYKVDTHYWMWDAPVEEKYEFIRPNIDLEGIILVIIQARVNQSMCGHEDQEKTGEQIPMGSFTAQPRRCMRCGLRFSDD